jgi:hypothetical protein
LTWIQTVRYQAFFWKKKKGKEKKKSQLGTHTLSA